MQKPQIKVIFSDERLITPSGLTISILNASHNVFLVQHVETGKLYVKKILSVYDKAVYDQLCQYPLANTPRIYSVVEDDLHLIIIEEYINGETLEEIVQRDGPRSESNAVQILMQLCVIVNGLYGGLADAEFFGGGADGRLVFDDVHGQVTGPLL